MSRDRSSCPPPPITSSQALADPPGQDSWHRLSREHLQSLSVLIKCRFMECEAGRGPWKVMEHMVPRPLGDRVLTAGHLPRHPAKQVSVTFPPLTPRLGAVRLTSHSAASLLRWRYRPLHETSVIFLSCLYLGTTSYALSVGRRRALNLRKLHPLYPTRHGF